MNLDDKQRQTITKWIEEGLKVAEIQTRMDKELKLRMTYMEVRFLIDDLKLKLKDPEPEKPAEPPADDVVDAEPAADDAGLEDGEPAEPAAPGTGQVSVVVDQITRPGTVVSGKVTFSDGNKADWYLDQFGRLGLTAAKEGYRPPQEDMMHFQKALQAELAKMGF